jgi:hypothetical protein
VKIDRKNDQHPINWSHSGRGFRSDDPIEHSQQGIDMADIVLRVLREYALTTNMAKKGLNALFRAQQIEAREGMKFLRFFSLLLSLAGNACGHVAEIVAHEI